MGAVAAAVIVRKEREVVEAFRRAGAISSAKPATFAALNLHEGVATRRLIARAVLREAVPGSFYLDEPSWEALRSTRRRMAVLMCALAVIAVIGVLLGTRQ
jgi:hypothetical protein